MAAAEPFSSSLKAAVSRVLDVETIGIDKALITDVMMLSEAAHLLLAVGDYKRAYESGSARFYSQMLFRVTAFFQQLHAMVALVAHRALSERGLAPGESIDALRRGAKRDSVLAALLVQHAADVALLDHLCRVRNKAIQHRAKEGLLFSNAIVLSDGFALVRGSPSLDAKTWRKAQGLLKGFKRRYGIPAYGTTGVAETLAYLELIAYQLREPSPAECRSALAIVESAGAYLAVVSAPMITAVDASLANLIGLVPEPAREG